MSRLRCVLALAALSALLFASSKTRGDDDLKSQLPRISPTEPAEALAKIRNSLPPGLDVIQAAAEPLVADPVAVCYDEAGRLYVVEMRGYPFPEPKPTGSIKRLVDDNGDGVFDRSTVFLDGLDWPTSVLPYKGGVFIAAAPDIIYARDNNGDGVADTRKVVFTGFGRQNVQQLLNGLSYGLDGWVYGAAAGNGGEIKNPSRPDDKPVLIRGRDFRFKPDGSAFEAISGGGQFGRVFDDFGHVFVCNNRWHARQLVLPAEAIANNPDLVVPGVIADIAVDGNEAPVYRVSPPEPWRVVRSKQYEAKMKTDPIFARRLPNAERHPAGFFSSASGMTIYRGTSLPKEYQGNAFVCDVAGNLVHRKILVPNGAIFRAERAHPEDKHEFLASPDIWFRPVNLANTPDGTLLVLDMYRETIEHPLSIPDDIKAHLDLSSGKTRGRIYEVIPKGFVRKPRPKLDGARPGELVNYLGHPDAWVRETAQRLLLEAGPNSAVIGALRQRVQHPSPLARLHALWTLHNLDGGLDKSSLINALRDPIPGVRENALRLVIESPEYRASTPALASALANDPDPMVRFQAALALGFWKMDPDEKGDSGRITQALAKIAVRDAKDRWTRAAVFSALQGRTLSFLQTLRDVPGFFASADGRVWLEDLAELVGAAKDAGQRDSLLTLYLTPETDPALARAVVVGLGRGLQRSGRKPEVLFEGENQARLAALIDKAAERARGFSRPTPDRIEAIRLVAMGPADRAIGTLPDLLDAQESPEIQVEVLRALAATNHPQVAATVLDRWKSLSPNVRSEAAEVLLARPDRVARLLDAVEGKTLASSDLDPIRRKQLREHPTPALRERAQKLLGEESEGDRAAVIASFRKALEQPGDRERGILVFRKVCYTCHKVGNEGNEVGPSLTTAATKPPEELLIHILDPNREVAPAFVNYNIAMKDGRVVSGVVAEETVTALTLKRAEGVTEVIPRTRVDAIQATGLSLMPEGLEKTLSVQDLADVIAFVRGLGQPAAGR